MNCVITPIKQSFDKDHLNQCIDSVESQTVQCHHVRVWDGAFAGIVNGTLGDFTNLVVPLCNDYGNTPRMIGTTYAWMQLRADWVFWLDADNWWEPDHVEHLLSLHNETGKSVVSSGRWIVKEDGSCPVRSLREDHEFADTSTLGFSRAAWMNSLLSVPLKPEQQRYADKCISANSANRMARSDKPTCWYRSNYLYHKELFGWDGKPGQLWRDLYGNMVESE